ncbi:MAG: hypothetical protein PSN04_03285 [Methyloprofundus sp.]|nr:hypothetical protein [Methyloprofundus sp.]
MSLPIEVIENKLTELCANIGSVAEKNGQYTHGLALRLSKLDKPLDQLTLAEFAQQIELATKSYNAVFGGGNV